MNDREQLTRIKNDLERLNDKVKAFIKDNQQDPLFTKYVRTDSEKGLMLNESSEYFTDEEREVLHELTALSNTIGELRNSAYSKYLELQEYSESDKRYYDSIVKTDKPIKEMLDDAMGIYADVNDAEEKCSEIIETLQKKGWLRYIDSRFCNKKGKFVYGKLTKEVHDIMNCIKLAFTADLLTSEEAKKVFNNIPLSLYIDINIEPFAPMKRSIITPTNLLLIDDVEEMYKMLIEPYFYYQLLALDRHNHPNKKELRADIDHAIEGWVAKIKDALVTENNLQAEMEEEKEHLTRLPVESISFTSTKLEREIFQGKFSKNTVNHQITLFELEKGKDGETESKKESVNSYVSTSYKDLPGVIGLEDFTPDHESIYDAIASEFKAGNRYVTTRMIHKTNMGGVSTAKLTPKKKAEIDEFIETATVTRITIDNKEYASRTGKSDFLKVTDNLLDMAKVEQVTMDGVVIKDVWYIKSRPILHSYAESIGQSKDEDIKLLQTGTSSNYIPLRNYLLRQIRYMKDSAWRNHVIKFDTIFELLYDSPNTKMKDRIRENTNTMLDEWIRKNHIQSYEPIEEHGKRKPVGVRIYLDGESLTKQADKVRGSALKG